MQFLGLFAFVAAAAAAILKREDVSNAVKVTAVGDGLLVYDADLVYANRKSSPKTKYFPSADMPPLQTLSGWVPSDTKTSPRRFSVSLLQVHPVS
jgi:hypothetical protein